MSDEKPEEVESMPEDNEKTYVTFKWMLAQTLALIISVVVMGWMIVSSITGKIDGGLSTKVSIIQFEERTKSLAKADSDLCLLMEQFAKEKVITNDKLELIGQYLAVLLGSPLTKSGKGK